MLPGLRRTQVDTTQNPLQHARDIAIDDGDRFGKGDAGNGRSRVASDAGECE